MCKTYDAIWELSKHAKSNTLICSLNHAKIEGELFRCSFHDDSNKAKNGECYDGIITLKNATVSCPKDGYSHEYEWINISSKHIQAFAFKCCEKQG